MPTSPSPAISARPDLYHGHRFARGDRALGSYAAARARLPELAPAEHVQVRAVLRCNDRVEQAHQPTHVRERVMRRLKSVASAQRFVEAFSRVANLFRPQRKRTIRGRHPTAGTARPPARSRRVGVATREV